MRNHGCTFARTCPSYEHDSCQGCQENNRTGYTAKNPVIEKFKQAVKKEIDEKLIDALGYKSKKKANVSPMEIKAVYFNKPMTIVIWADGTKTIVTCQKGDKYSKETGLAVAIAKKAYGNKSGFNEVFKKWIPEYDTPKEVKEEKKPKTKTKEKKA